MFFGRKLEASSPSRPEMSIFQDLEGREALIAQLTKAALDRDPSAFASELKDLLGRLLLFVSYRSCEHTVACAENLFCLQILYSSGQTQLQLRERNNVSCSLLSL